MSASDISAPVQPRIKAIDMLRGLALVCMAMYHFTWDLEFFSYLGAGAATAGPMKWFARAIASSFLMLAGFSLVLAHGEAVRWRSFARRFAMVGGAAALITLGTYVFMGRGFIFFGILHQIALGSLIGLAFLRLPVPVTLAAAACLMAAPHYLRGALFDAPALWWAGLSSIDPPSNDYVPVFPWTGMVLIGIAIGRIAQQTGVLRSFASVDASVSRLGSGLVWLGRHSLLFYLVHQPVLISAVYLFSLAVPAPAADPAVIYQNACMQNCEISRQKQFCEAFCPCVKNRMEVAGKFNDLTAGKLDPQTDPSVLDSVSACSTEAEQNGR